ncbi:phosphatidylserine decarboxylase [Wielerella bovis]|uniref:phosphatidylserine decarboxylase n=1 Tax=Wielerella bovis TaxID=2917790 RepID=UPI0020199A88|nr:phosphatidylserine decarboxylase [Wielerella bovis]ULJ60338.1 phosphatidylserine decarboxylase [Wielerella bovis]
MKTNRFYPHPIIAQEGWYIIGIFVLWTLGLIVYSDSNLWQAFALLCTTCVVFLFRDVARNIPMDEQAILCPSDGRILLVEQSHDPLHNTDALKISIITKSTRGYALRAPISGTLTHVGYTEGKHYRAKHDRAGSLNTRYTLHIVAANQIACTLVQASGKIARKVRCYVAQNHHIVRGERFGFTLLGGRMDIYLPINAVPNVAIGDRVRASSTILARVPLEQTQS